MKMFVRRFFLSLIIASGFLCGCDASSVAVMSPQEEASEQLDAENITAQEETNDILSDDSNKNPEELNERSDLMANEAKPNTADNSLLAAVDANTEQIDQEELEDLIRQEELSHIDVDGPDFEPVLKEGQILLIENKYEFPSDLMNGYGYIPGLEIMFSKGLLDAGYDPEKLYHIDIDMSSLNQVYDPSKDKYGLVSFMFKVRETDDVFVFFYTVDKYYVSKIDLEKYNLVNTFDIADILQIGGGEDHFKKILYCNALYELPEYTEFYVVNESILKSRNQFNIESFDHTQYAKCWYDKSKKSWKFLFMDKDPDTDMSAVYSASPANVIIDGKYNDGTPAD